MNITEDIPRKLQLIDQIDSHYPLVIVFKKIAQNRNRNFLRSFDLRMDSDYEKKIEELRKSIKSFSDFPKKGILFW